MKILVTGAAGFIGFHLIKKLADTEHSIIGLDNLNSYYDIQLKSDRLSELGINSKDSASDMFISSDQYKNFRFVKADITDRERINQLFKEESFDVVCHLAAQAGVRYSIENPSAYIDTNIVGFFNMLETVRQYPPRHFIYASSSSVYGLNDKYPYSENDPTDAPVSLYAATKKADELMAHSYSYLYNLPVTGVRFFTVYGPWGRPDMAPMLFMNAILKDKPIKVYNQGNLMRDFTYVEDIVEGLIRIISEEVNPDKLYRIYNIGSSSPVSLMEFITTLEKVIGKQAIKEFVGMQSGDVLKTYADVTSLKNDFNYSPHFNLEDGLKELFYWYKSYYQ